jgi:EAL domain-containing protein (putative c-di-GMP-specific phosphodiesterase class I)/ActR/RegA family two-component response regulator
MLTEVSVLVVDDDDFVRSTLLRQLATLGIARSAGAASGAQARQLLAQATYDVVITDLQMPGEDGLQLLRSVAENQPNAAVILISGVDPRLLRAADDVARLRGIHVLGSLTKPVSTIDLRTLLDAVGNTATPAPGAAPIALMPIDASRLRSALESDLITIALQPQALIKDGRICGAEALARWTDPELGSIPAQDFVEVAEQSGLIEALTDSIVRQSFAVAAHWAHIGLPVRLSVNLSPDTLGVLDAPERLLAQARQAGVSPDQITLEVTERGISGDATDILEVLARLRLLGFRLALDDFGTGFSSLERLNRMPFTELKLDRSFVIMAPTDTKARSILHSSLVLARDLGLFTVAEGVETAEQLALLRDLGCDAIQGYWLSPAMPPSALPVWASPRMDSGLATRR